MDRLVSVAIAVFAIILWGASVAFAQPNFVYILADDMGYGDWPSAMRTPNIDRLGDEGTRLTAFYAAPICTPSRSALLTGRYQIRDGWGWALSVKSTDGIDRITTIPSKLKEAGYTSAAIGKWHLGMLPEFDPTRHGFAKSFTVPHGNNMTPLYAVRNGTVAPEKLTQATLTDAFTDEAVKFIDQNKAKPFFLYLAYTGAHTPFPSGCAYACVIEGMDRGVGRVMDALRSAGIAENTVVIFTSDNGPALYEGPGHGSAGPFRDGKRSIYEGGIRVPFVARGPGIPANRRVDDPAMNIDIYPTLVNWAGLRINEPGRFDGEDIGPLLRGEGPRPGENEFMFYTQSGSIPRLGAFRDGDWKLIFDRNGKATKLFNIIADPGESNDRSGVEIARRQSMVERARQIDAGLPRDHGVKK